jgi:hypothetical protein
MAKKSEKECFVPDCTREIYSRGVCRNHYQSLAMQVRLKETTWEELEELGLAARRCSVRHNDMAVLIESRRAAAKK